jgi:peptidoglycan/xylan/chitin deacetylase (PgdA/CDA1 family)
MGKYKKLLVFIVLSFSIFLIFSINKPQAKHAITLVFDDGYENIYWNAYPLLKTNGIKAMVCIITNLTEFEGESLMKLNQLREIYENGFEVCSHTMTHQNLTKLDNFTLQAELEKSKEWIEINELGNATLLSYPYGEYDERVKEFAKKYYLFARTAEKGLNDFSPSLDLKTCLLWGNETNNSLEECKEYVRAAAKEGKWGIITLHGVVKENSHKKLNSKYSWVTQSILKDFILFLKNGNYNIRVLSELVK